jgi:amino acid permease
MFSILNEIKDNSHFQTTSVVFASIGGAASIYILVAITGYLSFGNSIGGNIVSMYPPSVSSTIGRAAIVVLVMFSYPLQVHPCRASIDAVLKWRWTSKSAFGTDPSSPNRHPLLPRITRGPPEPMSDVRFAAITTVIIIMTFTTSMTVSSLEAVLAYVGSTGSTSISFILPGLFYYKISSPESTLHQRLLKEDDEVAEDIDSDDGHDNPGSDGEDQQQGQGLLRGSGFLSSSGLWGNSTKIWRRELIRRLSLALAIYGIMVMVVCLIMNTFFHASK